MSFNQSRTDKSETQNRRAGRSGSINQQRGSSGAYGRGGGVTAPSPAGSSNRSFKKSNSNAQGGQSRAPNVPSVNYSADGNAAALRGMQNGAHIQPQFHGATDAPASVPPAAKQAESSSSTPRSGRGVPKAPTSQHAPVSSTATSTASNPPKTPGDGSKPLLQFGSISPGFVNGMQIPARTSSAPPNLDEQKRDQARQEAFRAAPAIPTPAQKQQPHIPEAHSMSKAKRDIQGPPVPPPAIQAQKPAALSMGGISMPMSYHQSPAPLSFGVPNPQMPSQQMPMSMHIPMGSGPHVPQQHVFVPGLQARTLQHQPLMHQGQNLNFQNSMAQLPPQMGNLGINIGQQYPQQQGGKFPAPPRKTLVKITNPKTHEELKFDKRPDGYSDGGSSGLRGVPQSQPIPSFTTPSHPMNFYSNPYNANNMYFSNPSNIPLTGAQMQPNSQPGRYNYPGNQGAANIKIVNPSTLNKSGTHVHGILESPNPEHSRDVHSTVTVRPASVSIGEKADSSSKRSTTVDKGPSGHTSQSNLPRENENSISRSLPVAPTVSLEGHVSTSGISSSLSPDPAPVIPVAESSKKDSLGSSDSNKDQQKKPVKQVVLQSQHQVAGNFNPVSSMSSQALESVASESVESTSVIPHMVTDEDVAEAKKTEKNTGSFVSTSAECSNDSSGSIPSSTLDDSSLPNDQVNHTSAETEQQVAEQLSKEPNEDVIRSEVSSELDSLKQSADSNKQAEKESSSEETATCNIIPPPESMKDVTDKLESCQIDHASPSEKSPSTDNGSGSITEEVLASKSGKPNQQSSESGSTENVGSKDKPAPELTRSKSAISKGKKKRKELLQKADAAGTTSDLYMAYKSPEEKKEALLASDVAETIAVSVDSKRSSNDPAVEEAAAIEKDTAADNWEDAVDIAKPKLETSDHDQDVENTDKKYSRDFLLKFSSQFTDVPENFEVTADVAELLISPHAHASPVGDRSPYPSPGRVGDRHGGAIRMDRRNSGVSEEHDRWNSRQNSFGPGREMRSDLGGQNPNYRSGQGGNHGVLRIPRVQSPGQGIGGILAGPLHSGGSQGGMQRNSLEADRWLRGGNFQHKGLIPSPQTPLVTMHKTENRYEVGKVTDEEQVKQRQLKAILNKLTPQNFEKLFEQVKAVNIDNAGTLRGVIAQIFDKALTEPTFCEMYANFCFHLSGDLPDFTEDNDKVTFKRLLLNKCQEEFERGEKEQEEADKADEDGEVKQSQEEREEKRVNARRRMLGNIRLIGELYKKRMLTERIMHECIKKLLGQHQTPDEEDIEALCKLMSTIGESIDHSKAKEHMDAYFDGMKALSNNMKLSSRVRFMLKDSIDLRRNNWQQRRKVEGPKKIDEVHRDAAQERQAQTSRLSRGPGSSSSGRRGPADFGSRGSSILASPNSQMGGFRTLPTQQRNFGNQSQDVRYDERQAFVPLTQRAGDDITLGPQGGLARGMSIRGPPSMSPTLTEVAPTSAGDSRRAAMNGYSSSREEAIPKFVADRSHDGGREVRSSDPAIDRSNLSPPDSRGPGSTSSQSIPEKAMSEERLREKSRTAIKEFYSARDIAELALCIKELSSPSFHPTMVSIWVTDSFEAKDKERELLAKLLVDLTTSDASTLSRTQLIEGFVSVLEILEETVTDAPKAPQYLGRIFGNAITGNVVSLGEIGKLIEEGGEEPGSLVGSGLAGDVLGNVLDSILSEKGDEALKALILRSGLQPESFRGPGSGKSRILEKFI